MNTPKAILFDLDDTLLAWSKTILLAWQRLCERHGLDDVPGLPLSIHNTTNELLTAGHPRDGPAG